MTVIASMRTAVQMVWAAVLAVALLVSACTANPSPSPAVASPVPTPTAPSPIASPDVGAAVELVDRYLKALYAGDYETAWAMLGHGSQEGYGSLAAFRLNMGGYLQGAGSQYRLIPSPKDVAPLETWLPAAREPRLDPAQVVLVEVDYLALSGNNAGWQLYLVGPLDNRLQLWDVR
jgi:hypothetical protein